MYKIHINPENLSEDMGCWHLNPPDKVQGKTTIP